MGWGEPQGDNAARRLAPTPPADRVRGNRPRSHLVFLALDWQGTDPTAGDVLLKGELYRVEVVTRGPTIGQFTLEVTPTLEVPPGAGVHLWRE